MRKITFLSVVTFLMLLISNTTMYSQDCTIHQTAPCPADITVCDGDYLNNAITWTAPDFDFTCNTTVPGGGSSFIVEFDLPESSEECWVYNRVQRIGSNNLRLFQSSGSGSGVNFITPLQYFSNTPTGININAEFIVPSGSFNWYIEVYDGATVVATSNTINISSTSVGADFVTLPSTLPDGEYKLKFIFESTAGVLNASNHIVIDRLYYDAIMVDAGCADGLNFTITSNYSPGHEFAPGNYTVIYTANLNVAGVDYAPMSCSFDVNVNAIPSAPTVSPTQPTCTVGTGAITVTSPTPGSGITYKITGTSPVVAAQTNSTGIFSGLAPGDYDVTTSTNSCESTATSVTINNQPLTLPAPTASVTSQPTCTVATGTITITVPANGPGISYTVTGTNPVVAAQSNTTGVFAGLSAGDYDVTTTLGSCVSSATALTINAQPATPAAPALSAVTQPTCTVSTGSFTITNYNAAYTYNFSPSTGVVHTAGSVTAPAGSYTVTATLGTCASTATPVTVDAQPATPAAPALSAVTQPTCTVATGSFTITNYNAAYTYNFSPSTGVVHTAGSVTAPEGSYTVTATLGTCASTATPVTINAQPATPAAPALSAVTQPTCTVSTGSFTITNYNAAYTYNFSPSTGVVHTAGSVTAPEGSYTVTATLGTCASTATPVTINAQPATPAAPGLSAVTQPTCTVATGSFTITNYNAAYTYTFSPSTGVVHTAGSVTAPAGSYTVTATLGTCASTATPVTINAQPATPAAPALSAVTQPTCTVATGSFTITNYNAAYTYTFSPSTGVVHTAGSVTAPAGSYTVTATLGTCVSTATPVTIDAAPGAPNVPALSAVTQPTCTVATGSFTITNYNAAYTYNFSPSTGVVHTAGSVTAPAGSYTVTATLGTCVSTATPVTINAQPATPAAPALSAVTQPTCTVATGSFTITNYNAAYTYTFSPSTGVVHTAGSVTAQAGSYTVTATLGTCVSTATPVTVDAQPATPAVPVAGSVTQPTCIVATGSFAITNYNAAYTYAFSPSAGVVNNSGTITAPTGNYTVTATNTAGCESASSTNIIIDVQPSTFNININATTTILTCANPSSTLSVGSNQQGLSYLWSTGATSATINVTQAGNYSVTVTNSITGCSSNDSINIGQNKIPPTVEVTIPATELTCALTSINITTNVIAHQGTVSYLWLKDGGSTGIRTSSFEVTEPGEYWLFVTDAANGCSFTQFITITQDIEKPTILVTGNEVLTCENESITLDASGSTVQGNASYLWSTGETTASIDVMTAGNYTLTVTDNSCSSMVTITVEENIVQPEVVVTGNELLTCANESITLDASTSVVQGQASYLWSNEATTASIDVNEPGDYTVTVTDSINGCSESMTITVEQDITEPEALISGNAMLTCATESITIDASGSTVQGTASYLWSNEATTATIDVTEPGDYTVTITDSTNGCTDSMTITVEQNIVQPEAIISGNEDLTCDTESITLDASGSVVAADATYLWSTGATTASIDVNTIGEYTVTVTDSVNGCSDNMSVIVTENMTQPIAMITGNEALNCATAEITLDASGSSDGDVTYEWSTGATTASIAVTTPGTYQVTVTDATSGCSDTTSVEVIENIVAITAQITGDTELSCTIQSVTLDASGSIESGDATYLWNTGATTSSITVSEPGDYSVTVSTAGNSCSDTTSITVTENVSTVNVLVTGNAELNCEVTTIQLDASGSTVAGEAAYLWNTGATTAIIEVTEPGEYAVTVSDMNTGCSAALIIEVVQNINPEVITGGTVSLCISELALDLSSLLPVDYVAGGTWSDDNNSGGISGSMFDPSIVNLENFSFTYTEPGDCGRIIIVGVGVNDDCVVLPCSTESDIEISKVVTANNDGYNDFFEISDVASCGFTAEVQIFNRWGKIVFESKNYQNNWAGSNANGGMTIGSGNKLPAGTYYYVVNIAGSNFVPRTGYIYLGS